MKLALFIALLVVCFLLVAETTITLTPFKISFKSLPTAVGTLLIILAIGCFKYQWKKEGYSEAMKDATKIIRESH